MPLPAQLNSRGAAVAVLLALASPARTARAENSVSYKYQDYREAGGRIAVETHGVHVTADLGLRSRLKVEGVLDALAGATPTGQPAPGGSDAVPLAQIDERRKAWNAELSHQFSAVTIAAGAANSRESDYVSSGWSLNTLSDFNQKNTTLLMGLAGTNDRIDVFFQPGPARRRTRDVIAGVTQLLSPRAALTFNVSWGRQRGYLSDPYKLVERNTEIVPGVFLPLTFPENRPDRREKWSGWLNYRQAWFEGRGVMDAAYRYYHDSFGTDAHTVEAAWFQRLGASFILRPSVRAYQQGAARFYHYRLEGTSIAPAAGAPRPAGPFYSSDYRLSSFHSFTRGLKLIWNASERLQLDAALERYEMRGRDGRTPQSAYVRADIVTLGARFNW